MVAYITLHAHMENLCIIGSGCSNHMSIDKRKFMGLNFFDGGAVTLNNNLVAKNTGKGTLSLDGGETKLYDVLYVEV